MLLTPGSKVFFAVGLVALAMVLVGQVVVGDQTMIVLLLCLMAAAVASAIAVAAGSRAPETVPAAATVPAEAPPPQLTPVEPSHAPRGGGWPALAAVAMALVFLSFVATPLLAAGGLVLGAVAAAGWMTSASADHTGRDANLLPIGIPVLGLFTIFSLMFFLSRVLLAVPDWASTVVALLVAVTIICTSTFLALRPKLQPRTIVTVMATAAVVLLIGGLIAAGVGKRHEEENAAFEAGPVKVVAHDLKFDKAELDFKSGTSATVSFDNKDDGVAHNMAFYTDSGARQDIYIGGVVVGVNKVEYKFAAPAPGTYFFRCDIHPFMQGNVKVS